MDGPQQNDKSNACYFLSVPQVDDEEDDRQLTPVYHPQSSDNPCGSLFSRIKQTFNGSSIASFLGHTSFSSSRSIHRKQTSDISSLSSDLASGDLHMSLDASALTPRRLSPAGGLASSPPVKSVQLASHSRSPTSGSTSSDASSCAMSTSTFLSTSLTRIITASTPSLDETDSVSDDAWSPALTFFSESHCTPPLTPDSPVDDCPQSIHTHPGDESKTAHSLTIDDINTTLGHDSRKGKEPAPPFPYETLLADISSSNSPTTGSTQDGEEHGEWWGLEYTIELSRRDSRASDSSASTTGEHSKSRESWAAIHRGTVPRHIEDSNFHEWLHWHRNLEKLDMRRQRKRTIGFLQTSDRLSKLFVDEIYARRALEMHENKLTDEEIYDACVWVEYAVEQRADPYFPPEKHDLGWVLKNHRSVSCLRELKELSIDDE